MRQRLLPLGLTVLASLAAVVVLHRGLDRVRASRVVKAVEETAVRTAASDLSGQRVLVHGLDLLEEAARWDPSNVRIPVAEGALDLLLGRPRAAIRAYEEAIRIEPRPEVYLNLGRALLGSGDAEAAREAFATAVLLLPTLRKEVPEPYRPPRSQEEREGNYEGRMTSDE